MSLRFGKTGPVRPTYDLAPDATSLPCQRRTHGSRAASLVLLVLACAGAAGAAVCGALTLAGRWDEGVIFALPTFVVAGLMALLGRREGRRFEDITIIPTQVERRWRGLFRSGEWTEPLSAFQGVITRAVFHQGSQNSPSYTEYFVHLHHPGDARRSLRLYRSLSPDGLRAKQEHYARLVGLPALVETADGVQERAVADLGKTVRQRVAEGSLKVEFDPQTRPSGGRLLVRVEGDGLVIASRGALGRVPGPARRLLGAAGIVGACLALLLLHGAAVLVVALAGGAVAVSGALVIVIPRVFRWELRVAPDEVRARLACPWGAMSETSVRADEVKDVIVGRSAAGLRRTTVQVITDRATVEFGGGLRRQDLDWVRDCVVAVLSA